MLLAGERKADRSNLHKISVYLQFHRAARSQLLIPIYEAECHLTANCRLFSETPENNSHEGLTRGIVRRIASPHSDGCPYACHPVCGAQDTADPVEPNGHWIAPFDNDNAGGDGVR